MRYDSLTEWSNALDAAEVRIAELEKRLDLSQASVETALSLIGALQAEKTRALDVIRRLLGIAESACWDDNRAGTNWAIIDSARALLDPATKEKR